MHDSLVRLKTAESELAKVMAQLQEKQKALGDIEAKVGSRKG